MAKQEYLRDGYEIIGVSGEKTEKIITQLYGNDLDFKILITSWDSKEDKCKYYSIYFLDSKFILEPLNNLQYEDTKIPTDLELLNEYVAHYVWFNFGEGFDIDIKENGDSHE